MHSIFICNDYSRLFNTDNASTEKKEKSVDSTFIAELEKAIQKRWDYNDDVMNEKVKVKDDVEHY